MRTKTFNAAVQALVVIALSFTVPIIFGISLPIAEGLLKGAHLAQWNGGNWIAIFCSLIVCSGYISFAISTLRALSESRPREAFLHVVIQALATPILFISISLGLLAFSVFLTPTLSTPLIFILGTYVAALVTAKNLEFPSPRKRVIRGYSKRKPELLKAKWRGKNTRRLLPWGVSYVSKQNESLHFLAIGNTGSGKSTWLEVMMTKKLSGIGFDPNCRAIVLDSKCNLVPFKEAFIPRVSLEDKESRWYVILNPFDKRSARWAIGRDINTPGRAREFARVLIPEAKGENRFWPLTARSLVEAAIIALQRAKGERWTLRDLINAFSSPTTLHALIKAWHPRPYDFDDYFKTKQGDRNDIFTTVRGELDQFQLIAALWEHASEEFSFYEWDRGEYILVLGSDYEYPDTLKTLNNLYLMVAAARLKQLPDDPERRVWVFADELVATGKSVAFEPLLQLGRSKGVCIVSSVLNMATFIEEFGENIAKSILALSRHKALFSMDSASAKFVSDYIGEFECLEPSFTPPHLPAVTPDAGFTFKRGKRPTILPQELDDMNLPQPGPENGLPGHFIAPGEGIHRHTYSWKQIQAWRPERLEDVVAYDRIDERFINTIPTPWTEEELQQLKLNPPDEPSLGTSRRISPRPSGGQPGTRYPHKKEKPRKKS